MNTLPKLGTIVLILGALLLASPAQAQTPPVVNPTTIEFDPSANHNDVVLGTTTPMVTKYVLRLYLEGASQPISGDTDLGKPTPGQNGKITLTNRQWFIAAAMNLRHVAKVAAVGPNGEGVSDASNPFGNVGPPAAPSAPVVR